MTTIILPASLTNPLAQRGAPCLRCKGFEKDPEAIVEDRPGRIVGSTEEAIYRQGACIHRNSCKEIQV